MSFKAITWAFSVRDLTPVEHLILVYLAYRSDKNDQCWPSISTIMEDCGVSKSSVCRAIQALCDRDLVYRKKDGGGNHTPCKSTYTTLLVPSWDKGSPTTGQGVSHYGTSILESSSESSFESLKAGSTSSNPLYQTKIYQFDEEKGKMKTADVIKGQIVLTPTQALLRARKEDGSYNSERLRVLWKNLMAYYYNEVFTKLPDAKKSGQLIHLRNKFSTVDIGLVMDCIVSKWVEFGKSLKDQGMVQEFPDLPNIGFVLKHGEAAVRFWQKSTEPVLQFEGLKPFVPSKQQCS